MDKREKILDTALKLFVEYGFQGTPTSKIAEMAEVSNGTLFRYFKTKDDLIVSLYIHVKDDLNGYLTNKIGNYDDIKERFRDLFIYATLWHIKNPDKHYFIQQFHYSPHMSLVTPNLLAERGQLPILLFREGFKEKVFKPYPEEMIWSLSESFMNGMYKYIYNKKMKIKDQKQLLNEAFEMFWAMLT